MKLRLLLVALALMFIVGCGVTGEVVKQEEVYTIGAVMPMSGANSDSYGVRVWRGVQIAQDEINSNGGINGKRLEIIMEDSMAKPKEAIKAFQSLAARGVSAVISDVTVNSLYIAPFAEQSQIPIFTPGSAVPHLRYAGDFTFRAKVAGDVEAFKIAEKSVSVLNAKKAAVIVKNSDYGVGLGDAFVKKFEELGGEIIAYEKFETGDHDFRTYLLKIKSGDPDVMFFVSHSEEGGLIVKQARELGIDVPFMINPSSWGPEVYQIAGEAAEGIYSFYEFDMESDNPKTKRFREKYIEIAGKEPTIHPYLAYDIVYIYAGLLEQCGEDPVCIKNGLYGVDHEGSSGRLRFDHNGDVIRDESDFILKVFRDGEFVDA